MVINYIKCDGTGNVVYLIDETNKVLFEENRKRDFALKVWPKDKDAKK